ncbi:hypothetical protein [Rubrivivax sp. JA1026]|uniref:hypothetical protein n=1 Tax=Rubrivivax sp. JA1026 TaxID=2710888 RepID=UPI0013E94EA0|nr:hypothetical protein [Rubrivivax sp. JA1026]
MDASKGLRRGLAAAALAAAGAAPAFAAEAAPAPAPAASAPALLAVQITRQPPPDSGRLKFRQGVAAAGCGCADSLSERDIARGAAAPAAGEGASR